MDMEGVALVGVVDDGPLLDVAELHVDVDAVGPERLAVDVELRAVGILGIDDPPLSCDGQRRDLPARRISILRPYGWSGAGGISGMASVLDGIAPGAGGATVTGGIGAAFSSAMVQSRSFFSILLKAALSAST